MNKLNILIVIASFGVASPAAAHDTETAYANRGACESASAGMSNDEKDWLLQIGMEFFDTEGDVSSFLTRAWTCDRNASDGQFYITDHVEEILGSDWFQHRGH